MNQEKINRINELAHKAKFDGLSTDELKEQAELRKEFLADIRADLKATLDNIEIVDDNKTIKS